MNYLTNYKLRPYILVSVCIVLLLIIFDLPDPFKDDVFFLGAAIHKTLKGTFENPYCIGFVEQFGTSKAYYYLPGQTLTLTLFTEVFGVSHQTFSWVYRIAIGLGAYFLLLICLPDKKFNYKVLPLIAMYVWLMLYQGYRPEPLGFLFLFWGFHLIQTKTKVNTYLGVWSVAWAIFTSPLLVAFYVPVVIYQFLYLRYQLKTFIWANITGIILVFFALYLYTEGNLALFFQVFQAHSNTLQFHTLGYWPVIKRTLFDHKHYLFDTTLYIASACSFFYSCYKKDYLPIFFIGGFLISMYLYPDRTMVLNGKIFLFGLLTYMALHYKFRPNWIIHFILWGIMINIHLFAIIIKLVQSQEVQLTFQKEDLYQYDTLVGDAFAAKILFDYQLPDNFKALDFYNSGLSAKSFDEQQEEELWMYNPAFLYRIHNDNYFLHPRGELFGHTFKSITKYPNRLLANPKK